MPAAAAARLRARPMRLASHPPSPYRVGAHRIGRGIPGTVTGDFQGRHRAHEARERVGSSSSVKPSSANALARVGPRSNSVPHAEDGRGAPSRSRAQCDWASTRPSDRLASVIPPHMQRSESGASSPPCLMSEMAGVRHPGPAPNAIGLLPAPRERERAPGGPPLRRSRRGAGGEAGACVAERGLQTHLRSASLAFSPAFVLI